MKLTHLSKLPWLDQSTADPIEKACRVLGNLMMTDQSYFFDDGFPRSNVITEQAANVLAVLNALAAPVAADAAVLTDAARYRWLTRQSVAVRRYASGDFSWEIDWQLRGKSFDAAVDAARALIATTHGDRQ